MFEKRFNQSPEWQQSRYRLMEKELCGLNLTDDEKRLLLWIAGFDMWSVDTFISIVQKARSGERGPIG